MLTAAKRGAPIQDALRHFNSLPPDANVRVPVVAALFAVSEVTVWRWSAAGRLPSPRTLGPRVTAWNVGEIREALRARQG